LADLSGAGAASVTGAAPTPELMRQLAFGWRPIAPLLDPRFGFYYAGDVDDRHVCGEALAGEVTEIRELLAGAVKMWGWYELSCDADECGFRAAEFETGQTYRFRRVGARLVFVGIELIEGGARNYDGTYQAIASARRRFARCPGAHH
jgi:hypothetical protein